MTVNQTFRGRVDVLTLGTFLIEKSVGLTDPGNTIPLIDYTVSVGEKLVALQITASCRLETKIIIKVNDVIIGTGRTGPGELNYKYIFEPFMELLESDNIKIECLASSWRPQTDIEAFLQARLITL